MAFRLTILALLSLPFAAQAQDAIAIKIRKPAVGEVERVAKSVVEQQAFQVRDAAGKALQDGVQKRTLSFIFLETILEQPAPGQMPTKVKRVYQLAEVDLGGKKIQLPIQGKTILIEKAGDKYRFTFEGGKELTAQEAEQLEKDFNKKSDPLAFDKIILPGRAVKLNDPWRPDLESLVKELQKESQMVLMDPDGSARLSKTYAKDNRQFGQIDLAFSFGIKSMLGDKGKVVTLNPPGKMNVTLKMDGCIDGTLAEGTVTGSITLQTTLPFASEKAPYGMLSMNVANSFVEQRAHVEKQ